MHLAAHMNLAVSSIFDWRNHKVERGLAAVFSKGGAAEIADNDVLAGAMKELHVAFLNGCESHELGRKLIDAGVHAIVCWETIVLDAPAKTLAVCFWRHLASTLQHGCRPTDIMDAFEQGCKGVTIASSVEPGSTKPARTRFVFEDPLKTPLIEHGKSAGLPSGKLSNGARAVGNPLLLLRPYFGGAGGAPLATASMSFDGRTNADFTGRRDRLQELFNHFFPLQEHRPSQLGELSHCADPTPRQVPRWHSNSRCGSVHVAPCELAAPRCRLSSVSAGPARPQSPSNMLAAIVTCTQRASS
eukprot:4997834-Prymnesium_polylepis.1